MELTSSNVAPASGRAAAAVGALPTDWTEQAIGQFCTVKTGPFGTLLKASEYSEVDGVPVISVGEIREGYFRLTEHTPLVPESVQRRLPQYLLKAGDVVFGRKGAVDRSALVRQPQAGWFLGSDGIAVRPSGEHCPEYVAAQFQSFRVRQWLASNSTGTTMASMNQGVLSRVAIPFPPTIEEERSIAEVLNDADALIDSLEQLLTKKRQIKQGAMQELLTGKRRLPGFTDAWEECRIGDFTDCTAGGTPSTREDRFWGGSIPWMSSGDLHLKRVHEVDGRITVEGLNNSSTKWVPERCVLIGLAGQGKTRGTAAMNLIPLCTNQSIAAIFPCESYDTEFLYHNLDWRYEELRELSAGDGGRGGLNLTLIRSITVPKPSMQEQQAISQALSDMDTEVAAVEARLTKARSLKQAMAQSLLTGRIRLVPPTA
ncbi:restriction endonuclease subunit S [Pelomonas sp. BJYL3]|uniref:restriction endonuclease subunit S n=1 Tax=Pelomonas sp. BJYL3 TaxID=2976697 RepID=UPI0022B3D1B2|nr:restriction endonuclease subunit S [Pelomonas sp. BJYL3]